MSNTTQQPQPEQPKLRTQGEVLVLLNACGYRLDEAMGVMEFRRIQTRLIVAGLLKEDGEPSSTGSKVAAEFLAQRKQQQKLAEAEAQINPAKS